MNFPDGLLPTGWLLPAHGLYAVTLLVALFVAPWRRLYESQLLSVLPGICVGVMIAWTIKAGVAPGLNFHLLGATLLTLMFGWQLAIVGMSVVLLGVTLDGMSGWQTFSVNVLIMGVLPVLVSQLVLVYGKRLLPKHFFIYVFVNAFFGAALAMAVTGATSTALLALGHTYSWNHLFTQYLPFFLLMIFPEAILTGSLIAMFVVYRPHWVGTFSDEQYLRNK